MSPDPSENSPAPTPSENPYYVLRRGEILGPFKIEDLAELVASSTLEYDDFAQQTGSSEWHPLRWLLVPDEAQDLEGALAPTWHTLIKWSWLRLRYNLDEQSLSAGWVCLGFAMLGLFLSRWPIILWAPWAVLAFLGGIALYRRDRPGTGITLMLSAAVIPFALWAFFWSGFPTKEEHVQPPPTLPAPIATPTAATYTPPPARIADATATPVPPPLEIKAAASTVVQREVPGPAVLAAPPPAPVAVPVPETVAVPAPISGAAQVVTDFAKQIGASVTNVFSSDAPTGKPSASAFVTEHSSSLVFVSDKGTGSEGSGFICNFHGKPALFTNIHVVAGMRAPTFTRLDQSSVTTRGNPVAAIGHDILHYTLPSEAPMPKLHAATRVEDVAAIGDEVFVLGNSEGARVITPLSGTIAGIGPELIEVTAEFVPGNSGSPIIHAKSGMVIGIATYLKIRDKKWLSEENAEAKIRRFGYRLDSVKNWQPIDWPTFSQDRAEYEKIKNLTSDLAKLLRDLKDGVITRSVHSNPAISPHVKSFLDKVSGTAHVNATDRRDAALNLFKFMRSVSQQDIAAANSRIRFDYFQRALSDERLIRTQFTEIFDELVKAIK